MASFEKMEDAIELRRRNSEPAVGEMGTSVMYVSTLLALCAVLVFVVKGPASSVHSTKKNSSVFMRTIFSAKLRARSGPRMANTAERQRARKHEHRAIVNDKYTEAP